MSIDRWQPREELNRQEQALMKRLDRVRKLLGFLRIHRRRLFDDAFEDELATMYRTHGGGSARADGARPTRRGCTGVFAGGLSRLPRASDSRGYHLPKLASICSKRRFAA